MEHKRPSLNALELQALRWRLGCALALVASLSGLLLDAHADALIYVSAIMTAAVLWRPGLPARIPRLADRLAFPFILVFFALDWSRSGDLVNSLIRLDVLLLLYRSVTYRRRREDLQLIVLGLFLIVIAGVLTVGLSFVPCLFGFVGLALALLLTHTLAEAASDGAEEPPLGATPEWVVLRGRPLVRKLAAASDWRVTGVWILLGGGVTGVTMVLFILIPRFELNQSLFLERFLKPRAMTGFTETLRFGDVTNIQKDTSVAVRVDIPDKASLPQNPYWRMVVLDEYRRQAFRASTALLASEYLPAASASRMHTNDTVLNTSTVWTFYVEPGVSRHLPLPSTFRSTAFTEPQTFRFSPSLHALMLEREPSTMKAYRVQGPSLEDRISDPWFSRDLTGVGKAKGVRGPNYLESGLSESDAAIVVKIAQTLDGAGSPKAPARFAAAATAWLHQRHRYSLAMTLPPGEGDPLVRWLVSEEPGHCELFAGALAQLCRAAGIPARVVCGFVGGSWNQDYLILRNSDAHAWCEIYDGNGMWLRIDPTAASATGGTSGQALSEEALLDTADDSWASWADRWRVRWYRQVVNFDQTDQQALIRSSAETVRETGKTLGVQLAYFTERVKELWRQPWSLKKIASLFLLPAAILFLANRLAKELLRWLGRSRKGTQGLDPQRAEASRWLRRLPETKTAELRALEERLQAVRYGPPVKGQTHRELFKSARTLLKKHKAL